MEARAGVGLGGCGVGVYVWEGVSVRVCVVWDPAHTFSMNWLLASIKNSLKVFMTRNSAAWPTDVSSPCQSTGRARQAFGWGACRVSAP